MRTDVLVELDWFLFELECLAHALDPLIEFLCKYIWDTFSCER